jgi:hypothetical protein
MLNSISEILTASILIWGIKVLLKVESSEDFDKRDVEIKKSV